MDGGPGDSAPSDGAFEGPPHDGASSDSSFADVTLNDGGGVAVPGGWSLVGLDKTMSGSCPATFVPSNVVTDPTFGANLCSYPCPTGNPPSCGNATLAYSFSAFSSCNVSGGSYAESEQCGAITVDLNPLAPIRFTPSSVTSSDCTAPGVPIGTVAPNALTCTNPAASVCNGGVCYPNLGVTFSVCIAPTAGQTQCPATGFTSAVYVSQSGDVNCPPASCSLKTNCGGDVKLYPSSDCSGTPLAVSANDMCLSFSVTQNYSSYEFAPDPVVSCAIGAIPAPTLANATMLCCQ